MAARLETRGIFNGHIHAGFQRLLREEPLMAGDQHFGEGNNRAKPSP
ncbi:hypothetical protein [Sphingobium baderi]|nr:hypothetical protein [Sphingobium baderi]WRD78946.1 hypothetical protein QQ987_20585 [Sphingobium baderi]